MKNNLLNISTLLAGITAETRYDLITGGTNNFTIELFPLFDQFPLKSFNTGVWLRIGLLLQNRPYHKIHRIKIWEARAPLTRKTWYRGKKSMVKLFVPPVIKLYLVSAVLSAKRVDILSKLYFMWHTIH